MDGRGARREEALGATASLVDSLASGTDTSTGASGCSGGRVVACSSGAVVSILERRQHACPTRATRVLDLHFRRGPALLMDATEPAAPALPWEGYFHRDAVLFVIDGGMHMHAEGEHRCVADDHAKQEPFLPAYDRVCKA